MTVKHVDYIQTVMGPEECPTCHHTVNQLWELVCGQTDEPIERACVFCAVQKGWHV
jgi:hypothetical protein